MAVNPYTVIEAEDFDIADGLQTRSGSFASGGKYVHHDSGQHISGSKASLSTDLEVLPGTHTIAVRYFDETDGESRAALKVDGAVADTWVWDESRGATRAGTESATTHLIRDVTIDDDARITSEGVRDGGEPLRVDAIELLPASDRAGPAHLKSFEGAEGFGTTTPGGRGGAIIKVTNLDDDGHGSLRWALEELEMPRIVVFDVGGQIDLKGEIKVRGDVTVAGQTAPGEGITVTGARLRVVEDDVIIRGLKLRPGVTDDGDAQSRDAISIGYGSEVVERVVIDGNSLSWAQDETAVVWFGAHDITFSNNIIAEGLNRASPSYGMLIADGSNRVTVSGNLFANNFHRNPQLIDAREVEFVNNVVSNYGHNGFEAPVGGGEHVTAHIIGNRFIAGGDTSTSDPVRLRGTSSETKYFIDDNIGPSRPHGGLPQTAIAEGSGVSEVRSSPVFAGSGVDAIDVSRVLDEVLGSAGARARGLDDTDARLIREVEDGSGRVISHPDQVGGYDAPRVLAAPKDRDDDGIPDAYESSVGSDPDRFDPHDDADRDGYSNIENYINGLIDGFDEPPREGGGTGAAPSASPGPADGSPPAHIRVQAEDFDLVENFEAARNPHADGGGLIQADGGGRSRAETAFAGPDGVYDLRVGYFDEADGVSRLAVAVEGRTVAAWDLDRQLGGDYVSRATLTSRTIEDVELSAGDIVTLAGRSDGGEPLRIDTFDFLLDSY